MSFVREKVDGDLLSVPEARSPSCGSYLRGLGDTGVFVSRDFLTHHYRITIAQKQQHPGTSRASKGLGLHSSYPPPFHEIFHILNTSDAKRSHIFIEKLTVKWNNTRRKH